MAANPRTAREYLRVSKDKSGRMRSPAETHDDNATHAEREGWVLGEPYREPRDVGASRYSTGTRVGFEALLSDLEAGRFGAEILVLWSSSRGSRRLSEWARFLELLEASGVQLYITSHSRLYDLSHWRDMRTMQEDGSDNEAEIAKMRAGILRALANDAATGQPHSTVNVGYRVVRDPRTGKRVGWEIDTGKAPLISELFERVEKGHSFNQLERDFAARGILNGSGRAYSAAHLRALALKPAYTGLRTHKGELTEATWPAIVPRDRWWKVQRILSGPKHQSTARRPGRGHYVYSMIIRCGVCGGPLTVQSSPRTYRKKTGKRYVRRDAPLEYKCRRGHVSIKKDEIEKVVDAAIVGYLSRPDLYERLSATPEHTEQVAVIEARRAQARAELDEAEAEKPATLAEARTIARLIENLTQRIAEDDRLLRELTVPPELAAFIGPGEDVAAKWRDAPVAAKRRAAAVLLSPPFLGELRVTRSRTWHPPAVERLEWRREES